VQVWHQAGQRRVVGAVDCRSKHQWLVWLEIPGGQSSRLAVVAQESVVRPRWLLEGVQRLARGVRVMKCTYTLDQARTRKLANALLEHVEVGIWLVDVDPRAKYMLVGPFDSISEAHGQRDYVWDYGGDFGRYLFYVSPKRHEAISRLLWSGRTAVDRMRVEFDVDDGPLEILSMRWAVRVHV
jgi:hypothetical protein